MMTPPSEPEHKKYGKFNKEKNAVLKKLWVEIVNHYWIEEFLIPSGETYSRLKRELFEIFEEEVEIALRDDNDLKIRSLWEG